MSPLSSVDPSTHAALTIVEIINHGANFGKHDDEWSILPPNPCEALVCIVCP
jgi:hypothetical protein